MAWKCKRIRRSGVRRGLKIESGERKSDGVESVLVVKYWKERVACFESIGVAVVVWCVIDEPRAGFCSEWARVESKKEGGRDETGWVCEVMWCALAKRERGTTVLPQHLRM